MEKEEGCVPKIQIRIAQKGVQIGLMEPNSATSMKSGQGKSPVVQAWKRLVSPKEKTQLNTHHSRLW